MKEIPASMQTVSKNMKKSLFLERKKKIHLSTKFKVFGNKNPFVHQFYASDVYLSWKL